MARYKDVDCGMTLLAVDLSRQLLPGTFEHALSHLLEHELDPSYFDARYNNDLRGSTAYPPALLLKGVLFAYSQGIVSSRAIDGVKLPSNASKSIEPDLQATERQRQQSLEREAGNLRRWLAAHADRKGARGAIRKSNRTDHESAKRATSKGVIQGYTSVAAVDARHPVIVEAQGIDALIADSDKRPKLTSLRSSPHRTSPSIRTVAPASARPATHCSTAAPTGTSAALSASGSAAQTRRASRAHYARSTVPRAGVATDAGSPPSSPCLVTSGTTSG